MIKILIIEDVEHLRKLIKTDLETQGFRVDDAPDLKMAAWKLTQGTYDIIILDLILPDGNGISLLEKFPGKTVGRTIIITANPTIPGVVEAIKKGAYNYLEKPVEPELLTAQINQIIQINRLKNGHRAMSTEMASNFTFDDIIHESKTMQTVIARAAILAHTDNTILLQGETGVGKEVLSHAIHNHSNRKDKIFMPVNCAAIPHELFESELFGFEKGAFTGAASDYSGRFIQADQGTLFLDEIGELPDNIQAKLLRILDEQHIYRLKSQKPVKINVRLITATNKDLDQEVKAKQFRRDLYYRLQESTITIPPLRERVEDILPLFRHFIKVFNHVYRKEVSQVSREAEHYLLGHRWEGNIRELKNTVKSIIPFKTNDAIELCDLSAAIVGGGGSRENKLVTLEEHESDYILKVLKVTKFNITRAAEILGITRARLYRKINQLDLPETVK
ncbi:MAG: sigma-54 dependent transcriptional regulator [Candidatus Aminicenantes bacterium]|nr:sigma-54 dependent transcriptional regulator [Candidatus Aminicenantes bacterium]